jgi:hypothetical protein
VDGIDGNQQIVDALPGDQRRLVGDHGRPLLLR